MLFKGWITGALAAITLTAALPATAKAEELYARVVDVGNAMCVVIRAPGGGFMLYDAGNYSGGQCLAAVKSIVGKETIDLIVLSHSDADHIGELKAILTAYKGRVTQLVYTGRKGTSGTVWPAAYGAMTSPVTAPLQVRSLKPKKGFGDPDDWEYGMLPNTKDTEAAPWSIQLGDATVTFVAGWDEWKGPDEGLDDGELNNVVSIVVRVEYGGKSILLTGDTIGRTGDPKKNTPDTCLGAEAWMAKNAAPYIDATVLIGQHHGGDNSSARCFIKVVTPRYVIFPSGHVTKYKHVRLSAARRFTGDTMPDEVMYTPGGRMFQTDRGDDQGELEWSPFRIAGCSDKAGDDDVEVFVSDNPNKDVRVRYRTANGRCAS